MGKRRLTIVVKGITGSGKTIMANALARFLRKGGVSVILPESEERSLFNLPDENLNLFDFYDVVTIETEKMNALVEDTHHPKGTLRSTLSIEAVRSMLKMFGVEATKRDLAISVQSIIDHEVDKIVQEGK